MTDTELARLVERGEMPADGFSHERHLRVALVFLDEAPTVAEAIARMSSMLRRLTAAVGKADKYSQPITDFWMYQLAAARALMPSAPADAIFRAYPRLLDSTLAHQATDRRSPDPR
ncbi:MAG TPA: hypothetical protein VFK20_09835 [Vicinamibacterales bacterium]|nr:hypothetical protein [Vicinamibacterales bacterium]